MANVTVNGTNYTGINEVRLPVTGGGGSEQSFVLPPSGTKSITANGNGIDVADYAAVNVNVPTGITPTGTKNITQNGDYDVTQFANAHVSVSGEAPALQQKNVTAPATGTTAVTPDSGYDGLSRVTVSPTPTETKSINANGTYTPTSGKHFSQVMVNVPSDTPETQEKTVTPSTSQQVVTPDSGKLLSKVTVGAMPSGTAGTPTATKGAVSGHSLTVTPSVVNETGYITGGTKTGTPVTVSASELTSGSETKTQNGTYDVTNLKQITVNVSGGGGGLPDVILPGSTPVKMSSDLGGGTNSTTDVTIGSSLTVSKAGTYRIRCSIFRSSNASSATWKLYLAKNGTRITSESPTWDTTTRRTAEIVQDVTCAAGDVLQMRGSVSSNSYYIFCSPIVACIDWDLGV